MRHTLQHLGTVYSFSSVDELNKVPMEAVIAFHDMFSLTAKTFSTKPKAVRETWKAIDLYMNCKEIRAEKMKQWRTPTQTEGFTAEPKAVEAVPLTLRPKVVVAGDDRKIRKLARGNPKKPGSKSHTRFGYYRTGMTVAQYLAKGGQRADLKWDAERRFIELY